MVSPISSPSRRFCPALGSSISVGRCVAERVVELKCPQSCAFNPFNPASPKAFDAIVGRGLAAASRWLEKKVTSEEWGRRFDAMDRRFMPERDIPLISYETQWALLERALSGRAYPEVKEALENASDESLRNDARLVIRKLAGSRVMLVQVKLANEDLPYYTVRDVFSAGDEYLYVDFGDQEPLKEGTLMFGRFLVHENCIFVIPGVFLGTADVLGPMMDAIEEFLGEEPDQVGDALQGALPEIWNLCAGIQDERDGYGEGGVAFSDAAGPEDPCAVSLFLDVDKGDAVAALERHPFFSEVDGQEFGFDPLGDTLFDVHVFPASGPPIKALEDEDYLGESDGEESSEARVGSVYINAEKMTITALNPVELELLKGLVLQLVACSES